MDIQFIGAIRSVTGSMHLVTACGKNILLDCGLYQGRRKEAFERNRQIRELVDPEAIDAVVLSHSHIDHSGNIPSLVTGGYRGPIYLTPATRDLTEIMLLDSAHIQERDVEYVNKSRKRLGKAPFTPLYTPEDIPRVVDLMKPVSLREPVEIVPGVTLTFYEAGHLLGAALTALDVDEGSGPRRLVFTGDLGRNGMPILKDPEPLEGAEFLISESTYGDRTHASVSEVKDALLALALEIEAKRSRLVIPAFSVGRTQEIVYQFHQLYDEGAISGVPIFVDSPLSNRATEVFRKHPECFDRDISEFLLTGRGPFEFANLTYIADVEDSKALNEQPGPMVIISASGMCEHGRILHHLKNTLGDPNNIVLIVGYQAEHTLGRRLVRGDREVRIFGDEHRVRAKVEVINALSAHADRHELFAFAERMKKTLKRVFLVHGEYEQIQSLAQLMNENNLRHVTIPQPGQRFTL